MKTVRLHYIGDHFYQESGTVMSPIYTDEGHRYDWGLLQMALKAGAEVHIRQATDKERVAAEDHLRDIKANRL